MNLERSEMKLPPTDRQRLIFKFLKENGASSANAFRFLIDEPDFEEQFRALLNILSQSSRDGYIKATAPPSHGPTKWVLTEKGKLWI